LVPLLVTGYWLLVTGYWLLVTGYWLLVTGYWLLVTGYWLLVTGYWLLLIVRYPLYPRGLEPGRQQMDDPEGDQIGGAGDEKERQIAFGGL
jgi:hypothetical protein